MPLTLPRDTLCCALLVPNPRISPNALQHVTLPPTSLFHIWLYLLSGISRLLFLSVQTHTALLVSSLAISLISPSLHCNKKSLMSAQEPGTPSHREVGRKREGLHGGSVDSTVILKQEQ